MHETSIAISIYEAAQAAMQQYGPSRLESVCVAVGELSAVEPELLRFAWEAVVSESPDEAAVLQIEWRPARQVCSQCGEEKTRSVGSWLRLCEECGQPLQVEGGAELDLLQVCFLTSDDARSREHEKG